MKMMQGLTLYLKKFSVDIHAFLIDTVRTLGLKAERRQPDTTSNSSLKVITPEQYSVSTVNLYFLLLF
jgi:hypothetical protein